MGIIINVVASISRAFLPTMEYSARVSALYAPFLLNIQFEFYILTGFRNHRVFSVNELDSFHLFIFLA